MHTSFSLRFQNPDNVRQFRFLEKRGPVKLYELTETRTEYQVGGLITFPTTSQLKLREILNESIGKRKNPWCFVQNMVMDHWNMYNLSIDAIYWWNFYSAEPKVVAFKGCIPYGFRSIALYDKIIFKRTHGYDEKQFLENIESFYDEVLPWQDRFNNYFRDIDQNGNFV